MWNIYQWFIRCHHTASGSLDLDTAEHIKIGTAFDDGEEEGGDFNGSMYDFRIYNKALDVEEVGSYTMNAIVFQNLQKIKQSGEAALNSKLYSSQSGFCDHQGHMISKTLPVRIRKFNASLGIK